MRRILALVIVAAALVTMNACILDPAKKKGGDGGGGDTRTFGDLKEKDDIFNNLELAYEVMNFHEFQRLLNEDFIFRYPIKNQQDVWEAKQWDRSVEEGVHRRMFGDEPPPQGVDPVSDINVNLTPTGLWIQVTPDQGQYPGETWYKKTVDYFIQIKAGPNTYIGNDLRAEFTIRWNETDEIWQIVSWLDDLENLQ